MNRVELTAGNDEVNLVLEGGGVKGVALIGAVEALQPHVRSWGRIIGTSAGAIVGALLAAGYQPREIHEIIASELVNFADVAFGGAIPIIGKPIGYVLGLLTSLGCIKGDFFLELMRKKLKEKGIEKFRDLIIPGRANADLQQRYKLQVVTCDITRGRMLILPKDATALQYGADPDDFEVALAVRASTSVPFALCPVELKGKNGVTSYLVDGGLLSNFPVSFFDDDAGERERTVGIRVMHTSFHDIGFPKLLTATIAIATTAISAHDTYDATKFNTRKWNNIVEIDTGDVSLLRTNLSPLEFEALENAGREAMANSLKNNPVTIAPPQPTASRRVVATTPPM
jgi:NTE family protein